MLKIDVLADRFQFLDSMNKTFYKLYIRKDIRHYFDMDTSIKLDIQIVNKHS